MSDDAKSGFLAKVVGSKRRWREYQARVRQLPPGYRTAVEGIERYLMHFVPTDGDNAAAMFEDLADLFEQAAADATPVRQVVGTDPVDFAVTFAKNYTEGGYAPARERKKLTDAITSAEGEGAR